jgi:hypothetical protein
MGKKTPANLAKKTVSDFFNSIGRAAAICLFELIGKSSPTIITSLLSIGRILH